MGTTSWATRENCQTAHGPPSTWISRESGSGPYGVGQSVELLEPRRLLEAYEGTAPEPLTPDEHRWLPGALALVPLHWAATAGLVGDGIHEAESAMTAAEAWWSRRAELSS